MGHFTPPNNPATFAQEIRKGKVVLASDGSVKTSSTQGWKLYNPIFTEAAYGHGFVPGGGQPLTLLRPKIGGLIGGLIAIDALLTTFPTPLTKESTHFHPLTALKPLSTLIDNKALISRVQNWESSGLSSMVAPEYDLLAAAQNISKKHNLPICPEHIKSHQDEDQEYELLPWKA